MSLREESLIWWIQNTSRLRVWSLLMVGSISPWCAILKKDNPVTDKIYSFDASVDVEADSEEAAVDAILDHCVGEPAHIAISLHKEGTLNHGKLAPVERLERKLRRQLDNDYNMLNPHRAGKAIEKARHEVMEECADAIKKALE